MRREISTICKQGSFHISTLVSNYEYSCFNCSKVYIVPKEVILVLEQLEAAVLELGQDPKLAIYFAFQQGTTKDHDGFDTLPKWVVASNFEDYHAGMVYCETDENWYWRIEFHEDVIEEAGLRIMLEYAKHWGLSADFLFEPEDFTQMYDSGQLPETASGV